MRVAHEPENFALSPADGRSMWDRWTLGMLTPLRPETPEAQSIRLDRERIRKAFALIEKA